MLAVVKGMLVGHFYCLRTVQGETPEFAADDCHSSKKRNADRNQVAASGNAAPRWPRRHSAGAVHEAAKPRI